MKRYPTTSTHAMPQDDGLTLDKLLRVRAELEALLPVRYYITSDLVPKLTNDGDLATIVYEPSPNHLLALPQDKGFFAIHPDNLPELERRARGVCRLVPLGANKL